MQTILMIDSWWVSHHNQKKKLGFIYLDNFAVSAAILPAFKFMGLSPLLYNASPLIFVNVLTFPVSGFFPVISPSNSIVNKAGYCLFFESL